MPIKIPETLPAFDVLRHEGVMVMSEDAALRQDIRPLQIGLLNLMPKKVQTETQFARVIGTTPLQIELTLIRMSEHQSKNTSAAHLEAFYQPFSEARKRRFDGLIITGAPIEHLDFEAVSYWDELREVFEWTQTNVESTMGSPVLVPDLPANWQVNAAELVDAAVPVWDITVAVPEQGFVHIAQAFDADVTWAPQVLSGIAPTDSQVIDGREWDQFVVKDPSSNANISYALGTQAGSDYVLLYGSLPEEATAELASSLSTQIDVLSEAP